MPFFRVIGSVDPIAVCLTRMHILEIDMPDIIGKARHGNTRRLSTSGRRIEETEFYFGGILGKQGEVDAHAIPGGTKRIRFTGENSHL